MQDLRNEVVRRFQKGSHIAHDEKHALRVAALAKYIAEQEGYDAYEAEVAGLLHDMGRTVQKEEKGHGPAGVPLASELLDTYTTLDDDTKQRILIAIEKHSDFKTEGELNHIVQDADKLDGLGAIGLMRAYTSKAGLPDYDPENIAPSQGKSGGTIHEQIAFQMEWQEMLYTETAKRIGQQRYDFMQQFLQQFAREAQGEDFHDG